MARLIWPPSRTLPTEPIDYRTYEAGPYRPPLDVGTLIVCVILATVGTLVPVLMVPRFEDVFRDFGTKLPLSTVLLLRLSRFVARGGFLAVWVLAALPVVASIPLHRRGRLLLRSGMWLVLAVTVAWVAFALFMPMVTLIQTVSGPPGKK